jgi:hypothetical protein
VSHYSKIKPEELAECNAVLLRALHERWPDGHFDEWNISANFPRSPALLATLAFLRPVVRDKVNPTLTSASGRRVERWLIDIAGYEIGGLRLERDVLGWCTVVVVEPRR